MNRIKLSIACLTFTFLLMSFGFYNTNTLDIEYPKDYFRAPLEIPLVLSGTFGELRNNHFHAGVDIKTQGKSGLKVLATADGFVSRIKVSTWGYGNALYVDHPNGYTTVYAHLDKFNDEIAAYVKEKQLENKLWGIDVNVPPYLLNIEKGKKIADSGNTGGSSAPHLHYEIRETSTEKPINPLLFGLKVNDTRAPLIQKIAIYQIDEAGHLSKDYHSFSCIKKGNNYVLNTNKVLVNADRIGVMVKTYDQQNAADNKNGPYTISMFDLDTLCYSFKMDTWSFDETRYINAHTDYRDWQLNRSWYNKCFVEPGNLLPAYDNLINQGMIDITSDPKEIKLVVGDVAGNNSTLTFKVQKSEKGLNFEQESTFQQILYYGIPNQFVAEHLIVDFPADAFYNDVYFKAKIKKDAAKSPYSLIYDLHDSATAIHKPIQLSIHLPEFKEELKEKTVVRLKNRKSSKVLKTSWVNDYLQTETKDFGLFYVLVDTIPPTVKPVYSYTNKDLSKYDLMRFTISDNLSGVEKYEGFIDDEWVIMEYDGKKAQLRHYFEKDLPKGEHTFTIKVTDACNNIKTYTVNFKR